MRSHRGVSYSLQRIWLLTLIPLRNKVPLCGGVARSAGVVYHPKLRRRVVYHELRVTSNSTAVIAKERETLKTLSYDCGNPVQYVCGRMPAVLFYLLDRHASLAMTKGTKRLIPYSLTTPPQPPTKIAFSWGPVLALPSNGGELTPRREIRVTSYE